MILEEPYFLENESWYYYDLESFSYKLTDEGRRDENVVKSYDDYYKKLRGLYENN